MAVEQLPIPGVRTGAQAALIAEAEAARAPARARAAPAGRRAQRALEVLPGALALVLISTLTWGYVWFPVPLALGLLLFDAYWLWKSWTIAYHSIKGVRLMREHQETDWRTRYERLHRGRPGALAWEEVRHVVLIPNYKESEEKLRETLRAMAACEGAREAVIPVLAMEEAEPGSLAKGLALRSEFLDDFLDVVVTHHPHNLPGEVRGKSANQAWAARRAVAYLVGRGVIDIDAATVTSCDADTIFPASYFACLTFKFATDRHRYRRFWQAPIFFYNNIWRVPAPLRVPNALSGLVHLSRLSRRRRVLFSQSTYSLSLRMAAEVGYWDADVIPEDWHMFLKCFYTLRGEVEVEPIHLPIGNDGALSRTPLQTVVNQYLQVRRWAWGASDIPYAFFGALRAREAAVGRRLLRFWYLLENHLSWSTQWFFITLGGSIPFVAGVVLDVQVMPEWFKWASRAILTPCLVPYLVLIVIDSRLRPPAPPQLSLRSRLLAHVHWLLIPPITFFFSALPALHAQVQLMFGRRMEYRVTEKA